MALPEKDKDSAEYRAIDPWVLCDVVDEKKIVTETGNYRKRALWKEAAADYLAKKNMLTSDEQIALFSRLLKIRWDNER